MLGWEQEFDKKFTLEEAPDIGIEFLKLHPLQAKVIKAWIRRLLKQELIANNLKEAE